MKDLVINFICYLLATIGTIAAIPVIFILAAFGIIALPFAMLLMLLQQLIDGAIQGKRE